MATDKLPAGRHGLPREFVARNQRDRILTAVAGVVAEKGYPATTVGDITTRAGVSRRTFYEHFPTKEECFLAAFEMIAEHLRASMLDAARAHDEWPAQVEAALGALLGFLAANPDLARIAMVEPIAAGGEVAARWRAAVKDFVAVLKAGRPDRSDPIPPAADEALVGGLASLIARQINAGRAEQLGDLLGDLTDLVLSSHLAAAS